MTDTLEEWMEGPYRVRIVPDYEYATNDLRDGDNLTQIVDLTTGHGYYGDRKAEPTERAAFDRGGFPLLARYLRATGDALLVLPLEIYEHSSATVSVTVPENANGFVLVTRAAAELLGIPGTSGNPGDLLAECERQARGEVEEMDAVLRGEVYGYVIEERATWRKEGTDESREEWEEIEAGYGFTGDITYVKNEAGLVARSLAEGK